MPTGGILTDYKHVMDIQDMECIGCAMRQRDRLGKDEGRAQRLEIREGGKANSLTTVNKDSMVMEYEECSENTTSREP